MTRLSYLAALLALVMTAACSTKPAEASNDLVIDALDLRLSAVPDAAYQNLGTVAGVRAFASPTLDSATCVLLCSRLEEEVALIKRSLGTLPAELSCYFCENVAQSFERFESNEHGEFHLTFQVARQGAHRRTDGHSAIFLAPPYEGHEIRHELTHAWAAQYSHTPAMWFEEGVASYGQWLTQDGWSSDYAERFLTERDLTLARVAAVQLGELSEERLAYYAGWAIVYTLVKRGGFSVRQLLKLGPERALQRVTIDDVRACIIHSMAQQNAK